MARDLGADERMVAVLQYLRVLLIVVLMPVAATTLFGAEPGTGGTTVAETGPGWPAGLLFAAVCLLAGAPLARLLRDLHAAPVARERPGVVRAPQMAG